MKPITVKPLPPPPRSLEAAQLLKRAEVYEEIADSLLQEAQDMRERGYKILREFEETA